MIGRIPDTHILYIFGCVGVDILHVKVVTTVNNAHGQVVRVIHKIHIKCFVCLCRTKARVHEIKIWETVLKYHKEIIVISLDKS